MSFVLNVIVTISADWSIDNLDETLVKIEQTRNSRLVKENDKLKKAVKNLVQKNSNQKENLLGA